MQWKRGRNDRVNELKLATYAEWMAGMHARMYGGDGGPSFHEVRLCEHRLLLLEDHAENLKLIKAINDSWPSPGSEDEFFFEASQNSYEHKWAAFDDPMAELMKLVRQQLTKRL